MWRVRRGAVARIKRWEPYGSRQGFALRVSGGFLLTAGGALLIGSDRGIVVQTDGFAFVLVLSDTASTMGAAVGCNNSAREALRT